MALFTEGFESGTNGATLSTANTGFALINGAPIFSNAQAFNGTTLSMYCNTTSTAAAGRADITASAAAYGRVAIRLNALPGTNFYIMQANDTSTIRADFRVNPTGTLTVRNASTAVWTGTTTLALNTWYQITWGVDQSTGQQRLRLYSATGLQLEDSGNVTYTPTSTVDRFYCGSSPAATGDLYLDYFEVDVTPPPVFVSAAPPTCSAGADVTNATVGTPRSLTGTDNPVAGSITARQWTCTAYPPGSVAPSIGGGATATMTFTPSVSGIYTFQYQVTNSAALTASDTVNVYVPGSTARPIAVTSNSSFTNVGGAADISAALRDELTTTYCQAAASGTSTVRVRLAPLLAPTSFSLKLDHLVSTAGTPTAYTVRLYEGATLRKTWTPTNPGTSSSQVTLSLTSGEIASITSWLALDVDISWQV